MMKPIGRLIFMVCMASISAEAQTFTTLATFDGVNGAYPAYMSLVQGPDGNFYGTTTEGGIVTPMCDHGCGTVFKMTPGGTLTTIHKFDITDGASPYPGLVLAADGNFYGITSSGGAHVGGDGSNSGTVFRITPEGELTTLYSFCADGTCTDGAAPVAPLVEATGGDFYGTASFYGANCFNGADLCGAIFRITADGAFTSLYNFCVDEYCTDGRVPDGGLVQSTNGDFYGTTAGGGTGFGTIYRITAAGAFTSLHSFGGPDGSNPVDTLLQASDGNLYGTTNAGGNREFCPFGCGTIFRITPNGTLTPLHAFHEKDGPRLPWAGLVQGTDGNLYGTTYGGGAIHRGTIFKATLDGTVTELHSFDQAGFHPYGALLQATDGDFYGTTYDGASGKTGSVFKLSVGLSPFVEILPNARKVGGHVIILGNHLTGSTAVSFNGTAATFAVVSDTEITAMVPAAATTGSVTVTTLSGTLKSNKPFRLIP